MGSTNGSSAFFRPARKKLIRRSAGLFLYVFSTVVAFGELPSKAACDDSNVLSQSKYGTIGKSRTFQNAMIIEDQGVGLG